MRSGTGQDERRRRGGGRGEGGREGGGREGGQADIKSNNPHLTGGEKTCAKVILIVSNSRYSGESWACAEAGTKPASNLQDYLEEVLALRPLILVKFRQVYTHTKKVRIGRNMPELKMIT